MAERPRHEIVYGGRVFRNDYVFPAEIAALRAHRTGQFQEAVILKWIADRKLRGTYVDVGAHIGNHSLFFAAFCPSTKLISIEGHPEIRSLMVGNLKRNLTPEEFAKVHIYHGAAWSKRNEEVWFAPIPRNNAGHCHIAGSGGRGPEEAKTRQTTVTNFATFGAAHKSGFAHAVGREVIVQHEIVFSHAGEIFNGL